jgi:hypothetical protein
MLHKTAIDSSLVVGIPTPLKNMKVSWYHYSQLLGKITMFQTTNQLGIKIMNNGIIMG